MNIDGKFDLMHYAKHHRKYIFHAFERYKQNTATDPSLSWYITHIYVKNKLANKFHDEYMAKYGVQNDEQKPI